MKASFNTVSVCLVIGLLSCQKAVDRRTEASRITSNIEQSSVLSDDFKKAAESEEEKDECPSLDGLETDLQSINGKSLDLCKILGTPGTRLLSIVAVQDPCDSCISDVSRLDLSIANTSLPADPALMLVLSSSNDKEQKLEIWQKKFPLALFAFDKGDLFSKYLKKNKSELMVVSASKKLNFNSTEKKSFDQTMIAKKFFDATEINENKALSFSWDRQHSQASDGFKIEEP